MLCLSGFELYSRWVSLTFFSVANALIFCAPPQIFIVAERTGSDLAISNSFRCHFVKNPKQVDTSNKLACRISYLVHRLWLFFTFQITLRRSGAIG